VKHPIPVPNVGLVDAVTVLEWTRQTGESVSAGETVAVVETEKAQVEIPAPVDGTLEIIVDAGPDLVAADITLGYVDDEPA
jgi:pyruvate/2-oxoglutarate dehydrogenase complex dihydrolipoamide acyltransferase (E2) component